MTKVGNGMYLCIICEEIKQAKQMLDVTIADSEELEVFDHETVCKPCAREARLSDIVVIPRGK